MKVSLIAASIASLLALTPAIAVADPTELDIRVVCPGTYGYNNVLTHHGDYVAGYGEEFIDRVGGKQIYFKSTTLADNTPKDLSNYRNEKVEYDSTSGRVSCTYSSNQNQEPLLSVSYTLTNGKGGIVTSQSFNEIAIRLPLGLRA